MCFGRATMAAAASRRPTTTCALVWWTTGCKYVRDTVEAHRASLHAIADRDAKLRRLCELHVAEQVVHVARTTVVQDAWARGQALTIHGCVYGIEDGLLRTLDVDFSGPHEVDAVSARALNAIETRAGEDCGLIPAVRQVMTRNHWMLFGFFIAIVGMGVYAVAPLVRSPAGVVGRGAGVAGIAARH